MITGAVQGSDTTASRSFSDRFELKSQAGTGGMGTVYQAVDRRTGQTVAVKILHAKGVTDAARFDQEAALLAELQHPGIVRYVDHGVTSHGEPYIAMEWLAGETLEERLVRGPLTPASTAHLARQILAALGGAHQRGVIHRDIKPSNIYLCGWRLSDTRLLDFGIARRVFDPKRFTKVGSTVGTPMYTAPEQAKGERDVDARADIFSLGCVLFECLTGEPPFTGESAMEVMAKVCLGQVPKLAPLCPVLPKELEVLIESMLLQDRKKRPGSAAALSEQFAALAQKLGAIEDPPPPEPEALPREAVTDIEQRVMAALMISLGPRPARTTQSSAIVDGSRLPPKKMGRWAHETSVLVPTPPPESRIEELSRMVEPFGGQLDRLLDQTLLVTAPGQPTLREQVAQLARAALVVKRRVPEAVMAVAVGRAAVLARQSVGEVVDKVSVMLDGPSGTIRVDPVAASLLPTRFALSGTPTQQSLVAEGDEDDEPRVVGGRCGPFVGRDRELGTLTSLYEECVAESVARAALVLAPSGAGKSRLRRELMKALEDAEAAPMVLRGAGSLVRSETRYPVLGRVLAAARINAADRRIPAAEVQSSWVEWLRAKCAAGPVVLVIEDMQWADLGSVQLIDAALRALRDAPFLVLALGRPEVDDQFPGLWSERAVERLRLPPLGRKPGLTLIRHWIPQPTPQVESFVIDRWDGNPLALEELVRAALTGKPIVPDVVHGMIEGRLDAITPEARRFLRAAAVFGDEAFTVDAVGALLSERSRRDIPECLEVLTSRDILHRIVGLEVTYRFRHKAVREAAYRMLPTADRVLARKLARGYLESTGKTLPETLSLPLSQSASALSAASV